MSLMIFAGLILLFYGIYHKITNPTPQSTSSDDVMAEPEVPEIKAPVVQPISPNLPVEILADLPKGCAPKLIATEQQVLIFGFDNTSDASCPVAVLISRADGSLVQQFKARP